MMIKITDFSGTNFYLQGKVVVPEDKLFQELNQHDQEWEAREQANDMADEMGGCND